MIFEEKMYEKKNKLEVGDVLAKAVLNSKGIILLPQGSVITEKNLEHLKNINEKLEFYVETQNKVSEYVRSETVKAILNKDVQKVIEQSKVISRQIIERDVHEIDYDVEDNEDYIARHAVNVAILSCIIGREMGFLEYELEEITLAGLLHDFAKLSKLDKTTLDNYKNIEENNENILDYISYYQLSKEHNIKSENVLLGILNHHKHYSDTQYKNKDDISNKKLYASILHLTDIYDTLVNEDYEAIKTDLPRNMLYLFNTMGGFTRQNIIYFFTSDSCQYPSKRLFDKSVVESFLNSVSVYNVNSKVILSNGDIAIVKRNFEGHADKPEVRVIEGEHEGRLINLSSNINSLNLLIRDYYADDENKNVLKK